MRESPDSTGIAMGGGVASAAAVSVEDLLSFLFPEDLQHPLVAGRLIAFALYGPLTRDSRNNALGLPCRRPGFVNPKASSSGAVGMMTGDASSVVGGGKASAQQQQVVPDWQLDAMCVQIEREDIINIYMHKATDMALLSKPEEEAVIAQADARLKVAKGRAMLPALSRADVLSIFAGVPRDSADIARSYMKFADMQAAVLAFRESRIKGSKFAQPRKLSAGASGHGGAARGDTSPGKAANNNKSCKQGTATHQRKRMVGRTVSCAVAPGTMFEHMKGCNNADVIKMTNRYLNLHAFKIADIDGGGGDSSATANVRLLRESEPRFPDPPSSHSFSSQLNDMMARTAAMEATKGLGGGATRGGGKAAAAANPVLAATSLYAPVGGRPAWDGASLMEGTGLGTLVNAAASKTTWKRKVTLAPL